MTDTAGSWNWRWFVFWLVFYLCPHAILLAAAIPYFFCHPFAIGALLICWAKTGASYGAWRASEVWAELHGNKEPFKAAERLVFHGHEGRVDTNNILTVVFGQLIFLTLVFYLPYEYNSHLLVCNILSTFTFIPIVVFDLHIFYMLTVRQLAGFASFCYTLNGDATPQVIKSAGQSMPFAILDLILFMDSYMLEVEWRPWYMAPKECLQAFGDKCKTRGARAAKLVGSYVGSLADKFTLWRLRAILIRPQNHGMHVLLHRGEIGVLLPARLPRTGMKPPVKVDAAWPKDIDIPKEVANDDTVPRELCCPISLCLMRNPTMVGTSGYT